MIIPVNKPFRVTSPYGPRTLNHKKEFHSGIDFVSETGPIVIAALKGKVIHDMDNYDHNKRWQKGHTGGNFIILEHKVNGRMYYTRYLHLGENFVSIGDLVNHGQAVGLYGNYGRSYGAHLHFDLWNHNWKRINPTNWFSELSKGGV